MGIQGVRCDIDAETIKEALIDTGGCVAAAARKFGVSKVHLHNLITEKNLRIFLDKVREVSDEILTETAKDVLKIALEKVETDLRAAIDAAKFIINKKGHLIGWDDKDQPITPPENYEKLMDQIEEAQALSKANALNRNNI